MVMVTRGRMSIGSMSFPNIIIRDFKTPAPKPENMRMAYSYVDRGEKQLRYDWNGNYEMEQGGAHLTDVEVAAAVRMLMRDDINHEMIVCMARDRIMALSKEVARLTLKTE